MKQKITDYILQNWKMIVFILAILLLPIMYRGNMEDTRKQNVAYAQEQVKTLSWQIQEQSTKLLQLKWEYEKWTECEKANSNTGTVVDCDNITEKTKEEFFWTGTATTIADPQRSDRDKIIMERVCKYWQLNGKTTPLCNNWDMFDSIKKVSESKSVPVWVVLGITYAESHIGINYNKPACAFYNNWGWVKGRVTSNGTVTPFKWKYPDENGCYLYKFDSIDDYFDSKTNMLKANYIDKGCKQDSLVRCIARYYVWTPGTMQNKESWINRVLLIAI